MLDPNQLASARLRKVATRVRHADGTVVIEQGGTVVGEEPSDATLIAAAVDESVVFVADTHVAIGAHDAALSWAALSGAGITHVLNVAFGIDAFPGRLVYLDVPLLDTDETELTAQVLERCFAFMDGADGRRVLVHCAHRVFVRPCFSLFPGNMGVRLVLSPSPFHGSIATGVPLGDRCHCMADAAPRHAPAGRHGGVQSCAPMCTAQRGLLAAAPGARSAAVRVAG